MKPMIMMRTRGFAGPRWQRTGKGKLIHTTGNFIATHPSKAGLPTIADACPGGYVARGPWAASLPFTTCDWVHHLFRYFAAKIDHTASPDDEPGYGADWENFWVEIQKP